MAPCVSSLLKRSKLLPRASSSCPRSSWTPSSSTCRVWSLAALRRHAAQKGKWVRQAAASAHQIGPSIQDCCLLQAQAPHTPQAAGSPLASPLNLPRAQPSPKKVPAHGRGLLVTAVLQYLPKHSTYALSCYQVAQISQRLQPHEGQEISAKDKECRPYCAAGPDRLDKHLDRSLSIQQLVGNLTAASEKWPSVGGKLSREGISQGTEMEIPGPEQEVAMEGNLCST